MRRRHPKAREAMMKLNNLSLWSSGARRAGSENYEALSKKVYQRGPPHNNMAGYVQRKLVLGCNRTED